MNRFLLMLAAMCLLLASAHAGFEVSDDRGHVTHFDEPPTRMVSLLPSLTETVCALGACEQLVGVDRYSNWPQQLQTLPQLGGGLDPNIEAIVALQPDVVLTATSSRASVRLRELGMRVMMLEPKTRADMARVSRQLGRLLQVDNADALIARIDAGVAAAAQSVPEMARGRRVYYEITPAPHAAGRGSFIDELLQAVGLVNIIESELGPFPKINPELVVRADPDLIVISQQSIAELARRPGWGSLQALRQGHVCEFDAEERNILVRPGPRMPEAAQLLADCVTRHFGQQD